MNNSARSTQCQRAKRPVDSQALDLWFLANSVLPLLLAAGMHHQ